MLQLRSIWPVERPHLLPPVALIGPFFGSRRRLRDRTRSPPPPSRGHSLPRPRPSVFIRVFASGPWSVFFRVFFGPLSFSSECFWPPLVAFHRVLFGPARRLSWHGRTTGNDSFSSSPPSPPPPGARHGRRRGPTRRPSSSAARPVQAGESGLGRGGDNLQRVCVRVCACVCVPDIAVAAILVRGSV